jgi:hypothetical protein
LLPSPSLQYLPPHIFFWSFHSIMSLTSYPSSLIITCTCLYHLPWYALPYHKFISYTTLEGTRRMHYHRQRIKLCIMQKLRIQSIYFARQGKTNYC